MKILNFINSFEKETFVDLSPSTLSTCRTKHGECGRHHDSVLSGWLQILLQNPNISFWLHDFVPKDLEGPPLLHKPLEIVDCIAGCVVLRPMDSGYAPQVCLAKPPLALLTVCQCNNAFGTWGREEGADFWSRQTIYSQGRSIRSATQISGSRPVRLVLMPKLYSNSIFA